MVAGVQLPQNKIIDYGQRNQATLGGIYSNKGPGPSCDEFPANEFAIATVDGKYSAGSEPLEYQDLRCISEDDNAGSGGKYGSWCAQEAALNKGQGNWQDGFTIDLQSYTGLTQCDMTVLNCNNNPTAQFWWAGYREGKQNKVKGWYVRSVAGRDNTKQAHGIKTKRGLDGEEIPSFEERSEEPRKRETTTMIQRRYLRSDGIISMNIGQITDPAPVVGMEVVSGNDTIVTIVEILESKNLTQIF
ncbi:MAG: hypothetical protein Q9227_008457 [Pyrenula ochraceoflavens]